MIGNAVGSAANSLFLPWRISHFILSREGGKGKGFFHSVS